MAALGLLGVVLTALLAFGAALEVQSDGKEEFMVSVEGESCDGESIGQNLFIAVHHGGFPGVNVTKVVDNGWWAEKKFFTYGNLKCQKNKKCGHYKQAVWAKSSHVGCSVARCPVVTEGMPKPWKNAVIFACDYDPAYVAPVFRYYSTAQNVSLTLCHQVSNEIVNIKQFKYSSFYI
ncbi:hypothetical protein NP493_18g00013 [Ridgeia piscesae]|uniref:SCP domain-containing protein n=1 Tax=Ridgeia piscesae TaxID=27915 RepID=A0AAD9PDT2_RIDPI|nr:hypothetical protein NP493_18g00013 [Ridgeia piscesae]